MSKEALITKTPVGFEWFEGNERKTNMPKEVMIRKSIDDKYVKFQPSYDSFPDNTLATLEFSDNVVYATVPELNLADLPVTERFSEEYDLITDPQSGTYYMFAKAVCVVFRDDTGAGFRVYYDRLFAVNDQQKDIPFNQEMFDVPPGASVYLNVRSNRSVSISNAMQYVKHPKSYGAISLLANRLFGNESQQSIGAASVIMSAITNQYDDLKAEELEDKLSLFFDHATTHEFSGSPQGAYAQKQSMFMVSKMLFGITFADYLKDKRITSLSWNQDQEMYIPFDGSADLYQEYADSYLSSAQPTSVMDYLYSKIGDKIKYLPQASIDDCVTKADCDALIAMLSNIM